MGHLPQHRVLVVDDEHDIREAMAEALAAYGYGVAVARNGLDALERARTFHPALIVLDLMMPVMDGLAFLEARRADPELAAVPVIVQTAKHPAPVDGCPVLYKPFDLDVLLDVARRCIAEAEGAPPR